jgi:alpha-L-arabinofuranosidase
MNNFGNAGFRLLCLLLPATLAAAEITITTERLARAPVDKRIYGVLLEHIGQQMDIMWSELLQDNSFEGPREYSEPTHRWAEGAVDKSRFWWHSGYELHPWRSFGAGVSPTFATNILHGLYARTITNRSERAAGLAQDGIPVKAGMTYRFTGYLSPGARGKPGESQVTVGLYADADLAKPYATATLAVKTAGFQKYSADLKVTKSSDNATFALSVAPKGFAAVDLLSLMPADNLSGWRAEVVAALKDMGLASFRYPGGCFASFVDWESMVGPPERRLPFTNPFWGGLEPNHVGTDEFLRLMELVRGEPLLEVNMISGTPERAAAWVEYCNGSEHSAYGRKRALNGHAKPYGVTYWELDNEVFRRFSAEQYAAECRRYAAAMRAVDPRIKLMAVGYFWSEGELETLLRGAAGAIDFLAVRTVDAGELAKFAALADRYSTPQHRLLIASTEWRNKFRKDAWTPDKIDGSQRTAEMAWGYGVECARTLAEFQRRSDYVRFAMFPTVSNLYGEDLMQIGKSSIAYTGNGQVFALMSDMRGLPLRVAAAGDKLDVNALVDEPGKRLVCTLVHGGAAALPTRIDLRPWPRVSPAARTVTLAAPRLDSRGPAQRREAGVSVEGGLLSIDLPPFSVTKVVFSLP